MRENAQLVDGETASEYYLNTVLVDTHSASVSGTVTLEGCVQPTQLLDFVFRPLDGSLALGYNILLNADGSFSIPAVPEKAYNAYVKGKKWLAKLLPIDARAGDVTNLQITLLAGDANDDNIVDVNDLAVLIESFDADPTYPNWTDGDADFNCDSLVSVDDLDLFIRNFDKVGERRQICRSSSTGWMR